MKKFKLKRLGKSLTLATSLLLGASTSNASDLNIESKVDSIVVAEDASLNLKNTSSVTSEEDTKVHNFDFFYSTNIKHNKPASILCRIAKSDSQESAIMGHLPTGNFHYRVNPKISPDGKMLAFTDGSLLEPKIRVVSLEQMVNGDLDSTFFKAPESFELRERAISQSPIWMGESLLYLEAKISQDEFARAFNHYASTGGLQESIPYRFTKANIVMVNIDGKDSKPKTYSPEYFGITGDIVEIGDAKNKKVLAVVTENIRTDDEINCVYELNLQEDSLVRAKKLYEIPTESGRLRLRLSNPLYLTDNFWIATQYSRVDGNYNNFCLIVGRENHGTLHLRTLEEFLDAPFAAKDENGLILSGLAPKGFAFYSVGAINDILNGSQRIPYCNPSRDTRLNIEISADMKITPITYTSDLSNMFFIGSAKVKE
ncbi:hypothetical protein HYT51_01830 [Candidatus Woesearchaeota archaeon]|nr:hypothetical protein [Candidatus Woesearchaeota archaeon]